MSWIANKWDVLCILKRLLKRICAQVASSLQSSEKRILAAHLPKSEASRKLFSAGQPQEERGNEYDLESYNDSQFYQQLLKEFLETKGITASQGANTTKHRKIKNARDRRASKGRRLRYDVQVSIYRFFDYKSFRFKTHS